MNICLLSRNFHSRKGGTEIYPYTMAIALSKMGHQVHIICTKSGSFHRDIEKYENIFIHDIDFKEELFPGFWRINKIIPIDELRCSILFAKKLRQIITDFSIDIVQSGDALVEGFWYSFRKQAPLVVRLHGHHGMPIGPYKSQLSHPMLRLKLKSWMEKRLILNADGISSTSSDFAGLARAFYAIKNKEIVTIYNGIDDSIFNFTSFDQRNEKTILFVGWLRESKGLGILAEAIPEILNRQPDIRFILIGKDTKIKGTQTTWKEYLKTKVKSENLEFIYPVDSKELAEKYYGKSTICIFPSLYEPGGLVVEEAMMCGCAIIATKVGGFAEFINDEEDGILIPPGDSNALTRAIINLLSNRELRKKIGESASINARKKFSLPKAAEATIELYRRTIESYNERHIPEKNNQVKH